MLPDIHRRINCAAILCVVMTCTAVLHALLSPDVNITPELPRIIILNVISNKNQQSPTGIGDNSLPMYIFHSVMLYVRIFDYY